MELVVPEFEFADCVQAAIDGLTPDLRGAISNVEIVIEDEPPAGLPLLGLYEGVPLTRRTSGTQGFPGQDLDLPRPPRAPLRGRSRRSLQADQARGAS